MATTTTTMPTTEEKSTTAATTNQDNASVFEDLKGFLQSSRVDLRLEATKAVLQVISSNDRKQALQLIQHDGMLWSLLRIVSNTSTQSSMECSQNALQSLLYLCSSMEEMTNQCVEELLEEKLNTVSRLVEFVVSLNPTASSNIDTNTTTKDKENSPETASASSLINYALGILANLTRTEAGSIALVGTTFPEEAVLISTTKAKISTIAEEEEGAENNNEEESSESITGSTSRTRPTMELLLDRFLNPQYTQAPKGDGKKGGEKKASSTRDISSNDPYQHFAAMLMNATQIELGRKFVLKIPKQQKNDSNSSNSDGKKDTTSTSQQSVLERLLPQLQHPNPIRRRGISGCIRNCCLEVDAAWWMLNIVKITSPLLLPLAGPEEIDLDEKTGMDPDLWLSGPDKVRETDTTTRLHLVESILLLCATGRKSRETLRLARTYVILKYADMVEEMESVSERINECVQYLRRDEDGTEDGSSDRMVEEATRTKLKLLPAPEVQQKTKNDDDDDSDYDDVD